MSRRRPGSARPRPGRLLAAVAVVLPLVALLAGSLPGRTPAAQAAGSPAARLTVTSLDPAVATTGATLRLTGTLTNATHGVLRDVEVRLRLSTTHLSSRSELAAVASGRITSRDGEVVVADSLPDVGAGDQVGFELERPTAELGQLTNFGVYVLGVEVLASRSSGFGRVAIVRTLLPWVPRDATLLPTSFSWVWPLVGRPVRLADGSFANDSLAAELAPSGRLGRLLEAGARMPAAGLAWAIDPDLVDTARDMADGYRVRPPNGRPVAGTGETVAANWLARLGAVTAGAPVIPLPYGDPDLAALRHDRTRTPELEALSAGRTALATALPAAVLLSDAAWPVDGYAPRSTLGVLRGAGVDTVLLDGRAVPPSIDLAYTPTGRATLTTGAGRIDAVLAEPGLADLLAAPSSAAPVLQAQRVIAETAMIASELPSGPPRSVLVLPSRRWDPDPVALERLVTVLPSAAWAKPVGLTEMAAAPPPEVDRAALTYPPAQRQAELPRGYLAAVSNYRASVGLFSSILTDPQQYVPTLRRSVMLLESSWWRGRSGRSARQDVESAYLARLRGRVRVQPASFTFSSRSGTFAVTVANELEQPVLVTLQLDPLTPRLQLEPVTGKPIGPGQKQQVEVSAHALAPGPVTVEASLRTPNGSPYGDPVSLHISITEYGTVALFITVAAAGVLFLAAGIRVVRRVMRR